LSAKQIAGVQLKHNVIFVWENTPGKFFK